MRKTKIITVALLFVLIGCAEITQLAQQVSEENKPLTQNDIIDGLKEALVVGTQNSTNILGAVDGYYKDEKVKILLPPEADIIVDNIGKIPGGDELLEDVLLKINRAAEDAVSEAKPIFVKSIKNMTIADGYSILNGEDNAATEYLRKTTYDDLFDLYKPRIKSSVEKKLVGNLSTEDSWDKITGKWNEISNSTLGQIAGLKPVDTELEDYLTEKALDGLFIKIEAEEKLIREDPAARVNTLLKRVFGTLDN